MKLPTLGTGYLYEVSRNRDRWLLAMQKRKAFRLTLAIFTALSIGIIAWIVRPL